MRLNRSVRHLALALPLLAAMSLVACSSSDDDDGDPTGTAASDSAAIAGPVITVIDAWARATPGNPDENSAVYMTITNDGDTADRLVGAGVDGDLASTVELHETAMEDGQMRMREVEGWDVSSNGGVLELAQRGNHVMLIGLSEQLVEGGTVGVTLHFELSEDVHVDAPVRQGMPMDADSAS